MNDINANFVAYWFFAVVIILILLAGWGVRSCCRDKTPPVADNEEVTEQVERIVFRTERRHAGCSSNGFWRVSGPPKIVEVMDQSPRFWPHTCSGCGATQVMINVQWPQYKHEWRAVK